MHTIPQGPYDIWIQSASGGEALLANELAFELGRQLEGIGNFRLLLTSGTKEGLDLLKKTETHLSPKIETRVSYFPFDAPWLMQKAFACYAPRLAVIVETELWPSFLIAAHDNGVPVLLVNGRMSAGSYRFYRRCKGFFHNYGPRQVLAISETDGQRFAEIVGKDRVKPMHNIKFDRMTAGRPLHAETENEFFLPDGTAFVVFGSIRRKEEERILHTLKILHARCPDLIIGLFPKHINRAEAWCKKLQKEGIASSRRSAIKDGQNYERIIVWDLFGELGQAYKHADSAFVGGSLERLGGHNFLEPLIFGVRPIIGPHWRDFFWVGEDIFTSGLVTRISDEFELADLLIQRLSEKTDKPAIRDKALHFLASKEGGTQLACKTIVKMLQTGT